MFLFRRHDPAMDCRLLLLAIWGFQFCHSLLAISSSLIWISGSSLSHRLSQRAFPGLMARVLAIVCPLSHRDFSGFIARALANCHSEPSLGSWHEPQPLSVDCHSEPSLDSWHELLAIVCRLSQRAFSWHET